MALIGVYDHERRAPQSLVVDLKIGMANSKSCFSDDLADAVDYDEIEKIIHSLAADNKTHLLEAFAQKIATAVLTNFDVQWVQVDIVKPAVLTEANAVGVSIKRAWSCPQHEGL
jgi:7,8-dihydroneopterin aldolase/epimerase/oxygenase